ncbi:beta-galactosidase isoform X1 [Neodiprion lecontei]|uniref:Beta-galactosidase n=1 Tax=Neodiprion lecontei TaxID=441921 RepID=A0A6J0CCB9_NEOLC|nr:beta-galactosidase isoform X1 [Neodiprion lecontei]
MDLATWTLLALALAATVEGLTTINSNNVTKPSFTVDYTGNQFFLDGKPFRYVSGSFHYFRAPKVYWRDRLRKMRAAGLNAVSTYVEWSLHQPKPNEWKWYGEADLEYFLTLAQEEGLFVLLRPGPYICAERDLGGFPTWLLSLVPDIQLRTSDTRYMRYVRTYINEVMRRVRPFLRGNGGPVIMVQVENEYGSYQACDIKYMTELRDLFQSHIGSDALLYTTDGDTNRMLRCGMIPEVFGTVDFGTEANVTRSFETLRLFRPKGPLVNSEFYPGWLTHWGEPYAKVDSSIVVKKIDEMLAMGASVNLYMFYGGTNFGFTSGANTGPQYEPQITSYDYDAPITEAGDLTLKYYEIKNVIAKYLPIPNITLPIQSSKGDYGSVVLERVLPLFHPYMRAILGILKVNQFAPPTFESFDEPLALVLYETDLPENRTDPGVLDVRFIHDRALVYEDDVFVGTLSRTHGLKTVSLSQPYTRRLGIFVENQGHVNFGSKIHDFKGVGGVTLNGQTLTNWNATGFRLPEMKYDSNFGANSTGENLDRLPQFLYGLFTIIGTPLDTFLDTTGWGKGVAFINGYNIGRYWPAAGPQMTLYVPASILVTGENRVDLLEFEFVPETLTVRFQTIPN